MSSRRGTLRYPREDARRRGHVTRRSEDSFVHLSDGRLCETQIQLRAKRRDKVSIVLPSLTSRVGWDQRSPGNLERYELERYERGTQG